MSTTALRFRVCILAGAATLLCFLIAILNPATVGINGGSKTSAPVDSDKNPSTGATGNADRDALSAEQKIERKRIKELAQPAKLAEKGQFSLTIQQRQFANMPVWVEAKLESKLTDCYPYSFSLLDFGNNQIEIARGSELVQKTYPSESYWGEASNSQKVRLPLHMVYKFRPGHYSVRWTVFKKENNRIKLRISNWAHFEIVEPTNYQDVTWMYTHLENQPESHQALRSDFIPSLIAAAPHRDVLRRCIQLSYHQDADVSMMAGNLSDVLLHTISEEQNDRLLSARYSKGEILFEYLRAMRVYGANLASSTWIGQFPALNTRKELFALARRNLQSTNLENSNNSIYWLMEFVSQKEFEPLKPEIDREVLSVAQKLIKHAKRADALISYFRDDKSEIVRELLWSYAKSGREDAGDALCSIASTGDPRDFARLRLYLVAPQGKEDDVVDRTLGSAFFCGYGESAVPVLKQTILLGNRCSVESWLCMERWHRIALFRFILDVLEHRREHQRYVMSLLKYIHGNEIAKQNLTPITFVRKELRLLELGKSPREWEPDYSKWSVVPIFVPK